MRGKIATAFIFLTMMTGAVSAAPVLDYTGAERLEEARQERLRMPRVENIGSSLNEKEETQDAAGSVFRIDKSFYRGREKSSAGCIKSSTGKTAPSSYGKTHFPSKKETS